MTERYFTLPNGAGTLQFTSSVLEHIYRYAQVNKNDKEAGGQLFSKNPHEQLITISIVTGPNPNDIRSVNHFNPNLRQLNNDRKRLFNDGFHAIGLWHTHPEPIPHPSDDDRITTLKYLEACNGELTGFIQVIVGNRKSPESLGIWLASTDKNNRWVKLKESEN
ncbi:hypothetical protein G6355_12560 [Vibrio cholerae]|uniref:Mov34/MPN/PAD-1 family protein n=1 Tax=Vibrio TaxID=662 RepID=UPI00157BA1F5|nr:MULTISPECIES: Mov34/MPN/PAD-1 family protein [Vibrio]EKF9638787.1 Mov34/MPN/PAD-1 family protein [Vibrio cholerae]ELI0358352.1 Mov34/MPN/PAD-1 family protein [Vibrio cholerae]CAB1261383.1 Uncharacterised protein [Vibrio cholerae]